MRRDIDLLDRVLGRVIVEVNEEGGCSSGPIGVSPSFETIKDLDAYRSRRGYAKRGWG